MSKVVGKIINTRQHARYPQLVELYFENGGEIPAALSGLYTSAEVALKAYEAYQAAKGKFKED